MTTHWRLATHPQALSGLTPADKNSSDAQLHTHPEVQIPIQLAIHLPAPYCVRILSPEDQDNTATTIQLTHSSEHLTDAEPYCVFTPTRPRARILISESVAGDAALWVCCLWRVDRRWCCELMVINCFFYVVLLLFFGISGFSLMNFTKLG
jgi:hypothetical protein